MRVLTTTVSILVLMSCGSEETALPLASAPEAPAERMFTPGQMSVGEKWAESDVLDAPGGATRIGMLLDLWNVDAVGDLAAGLEVRGFDENGTPTLWMPAELTWSEDGYLVAKADPNIAIYGAQLRFPSIHMPDVSHVTFAAVVPIDELTLLEGPGDAVSTFSQAKLPLSVAELVKSRSSWNARATKCTNNNPSKHRMALHHTFTPPKSSGSYAARVRSIQAYHMDTRGWCDVGYHFLVTDDGSVWEGRPLSARGAHVANNNTGNIGISYVGCYEPGACSAMGTMTPSNASLESGAKLMRALSDAHGIGLNRSSVKGHREHSGASTSCPGEHLLGQLDHLLELAKDDSPPAAGPAPAPTAHGRVLGVVWDASVTATPGEDNSKRITGATVSGGGTSALSLAGSAYYELIVPPGTHVISVAALGYAPASRTVVVPSGGEAWASIGVTPN